MPSGANVTPPTLMPDPAEEPDAPMQADRMLAIAQQDARIRAAMAPLPPEQAEVIRKAFFEDKVHAEIEKELGIPLGTVKSRLRLAMNRLRAALGTWHDPHHPSETTLLAYAAGTLPEALAMVTATHLSSAPACRHRLDPGIHRRRPAGRTDPRSP